MTSRGFSLVEVLIAMGLLGIVSLGMMQVMSSQSKIEKRSIQAETINSLIFKLGATLSDGSACLNTFQTYTMTNATTEITGLKNMNDNDIFDITSSAYTFSSGAGKVSISKMEFVKDMVFGATSSSLYVFIDRGKGALGGKIIKKEIPIYVQYQTNANLVVTNCRASAGFGGGTSQLEEVCKSMGATGVDMTVSPPECVFDVGGNPATFEDYIKDIANDCPCGVCSETRTGPVACHQDVRIEICTLSGWTVGPVIYHEACN